MSRSRFFSAARAFGASDEFFWTGNPGFMPNSPISVSIHRKSRGNGADMKGPNRAQIAASGTIMMNGS
jgi:hypothetical protein